jgi:hypothetical protein
MSLEMVLHYSFLCFGLIRRLPYKKTLINLKTLEKSLRFEGWIFHRLSNRDYFINICVLAYYAIGCAELQVLKRVSGLRPQAPSQALTQTVRN